LERYTSGEILLKLFGVSEPTYTLDTEADILHKIAPAYIENIKFGGKVTTHFLPFYGDISASYSLYLMDL
jgi:hypothetical protein